MQRILDLEVKSQNKLSLTSFSILQSHREKWKPIYALLLYFIFSSSALSADTEINKQITEYLLNLKSYQADFEQQDGGTIRYGQFLWLRPGLAKWQYLQDPKITIIIRDKLATYHDPEIKEINNFIIPSGLHALLAKKEFLGELEIKSTKVSEKSVVVDFVDREGNIFHLIFSLRPLQLIGMSLDNSSPVIMVFKQIKENAPIRQDSFSLEGYEIEDLY